ncbi:MAG TPA: GntR family transcriptional regulator [Longimicrobiales bacterium]|nr:GntR family transcriptional regulator [Longimicrobiales bacterium]
MLIVVDAHSGVPVYRQVMEQVRFQVAAGLLRPGAELPSTRTLSQELGVNPMTVSKAYGLLEEEGVVLRRPGLPLVVRSRPKAAAEDAKVAQLRALLDPVAVAAVQLGITERQAVAVFREALAEVKREEEQRT